MKVHFREEGTDVKEGANITLPTIGRLHIQFKYKNKFGTHSIFRIAIPREWEKLSPEDFTVESNFEVEHEGE
jgi:hypothetical protein